jgi:hypothetical protein
MRIVNGGNGPRIALGMGQCNGCGADISFQSMTGFCEPCSAGIKAKKSVTLGAHITSY